MTTTYTVRDEHERYFGETTTKRAAESNARNAVKTFGGCFAILVDSTIVAIAQRDGNRVDVRWTA